MIGGMGMNCRNVYIVIPVLMPLSAYSACPDGFTAYLGPESNLYRNANGDCVELCGAGVFRTDQGAGLWSGTFNFEWNRIDFLLVWIKQYGNCDSQIIKVNLRQGSMRYKFNVRAVCK